MNNTKKVRLAVCERAQGFTAEVELARTKLNTLIAKGRVAA